MDDRPRGPLTKFEIEFLGVMARNVMEYLEMKRESEMRKRNEVMTKGLAAFVGGRGNLVLGNKHDVRSATGEHLRTDLPLESNPGVVSKQTPTAPGGIDGTSYATQKEEPPFPAEKSPESDDILAPADSSHQLVDMPTTHEEIFARASNLLRESLAVDYTIFLDISSANTIYAVTPSPDGQYYEDTLESQEDAFVKVKRPMSPGAGSNKYDNGVNSTGTIGARKHNKAPVRVLSFSTRETSSLDDHKEMSPNIGFTSPDLRRLRRLIKRYPSGKLWTFSEMGSESSSEEDFSSQGALPQSTTTFPDIQRVEAREIRYLMDCFPGAKQLIMAPLWDAENSRHIAACFAVSLNPAPVITAEVETSFIRAFLNSVSMACSRANIAAANRQKGDFISSISHVSKCGGEC